MKPQLILKGERAQGLTEYALIILFVSIVIIIALNLLGDSLIEVYDTIVNQI